jgi:argininosuccinate lyase
MLRVPALLIGALTILLFWKLLDSVHGRRAAWAGGLLLATDVAEYLVARGMAFRQAHETVGAMVRRLVADGRDFESLSAEEWASFSPLFGADVRRVVTPEAAVAARRTPQSTNPESVAAALADAAAWLDEAAARGKSLSEYA